MNEFDIESFQKQRKLNIKKVLIMILIAILMIGIIILISLYISEENFRNWVDANILKKEVTVDNISSIDLKIDKSNQVYAYSKYIAVLNDKIISLYNNLGEDVNDIDINISSALFDGNDKYLAVAEDSGQEFCLILDKLYLWGNKIEGEIRQIHVNKNGYVAVVTTDTTYKSIINFFTPDGKPLFKYYFSESMIVDINISNDNKKMAIAELDTTGAIMQSNIKIISIETAQKSAEDAVIYEYNAENGKLITKVNYQDKNKVMAMYDTTIDMIENENVSNILTVENEKITFMSVNLENSIVYVQEEDSGIFTTKTDIKIVNIQNNRNYMYSLEEAVKSIDTYGNIIAVNVGTEMYFLNTEGYLIKKYKSNQEITNIVLSNNIAGIVYKDKVDIVSL